ncbi:MAG: HAD hydrolase-like protein, partial [Spirochaetia bacterium]|nr:HAD hydrolase-like protein [Spirochaetia bacterium]
MKIKAVFFDAGETLVHRNPSLVKLVRRALSESHARVTNRAVEKAAAKCAVSMKNIVENGRMSDSQKWDVYMKSMFKELRLSDEPLRQRIKERLKAGTSFRQYPEVPAVIRTLREQKMVLGVISNAPAELEGI